METDYVIVLSNALIRAYWGLGEVEKRILWMILSRVKAYNAKKPNEKYDIIKTEDVYWLSYNEYAEFFGCNPSTAFIELKQAAETLHNRTIRFTEGEEVFITHWIHTRALWEKGGKIGISFSPRVIPHLCNLRKLFTQLPLGVSLSISSTYGWRLYDLLMIEKTSKYSIKMVTFPIEALMAMMDTPPSLRMYKNFKKFALFPAIKTIEETKAIQFLKGEGDISFKEYKPGKKVMGITFFYVIGETGYPIPSIEGFLDVLEKKKEEKKEEKRREMMKKVVKQADFARKRESEERV